MHDIPVDNFRLVATSLCSTIARLVGLAAIASRELLLIRIIPYIDKPDEEIVKWSAQVDVMSMARDWSNFSENMVTRCDDIERNQSYTGPLFIIRCNLLFLMFTDYT